MPRPALPTWFFPTIIVNCSTAERLALERAKQEALEANRQLWEARRAEMRHNPDIVNDEFKTHQLQFDDQKFNIMHERPGWAAHREAMKKEFPDGWNPPRKVERSEMNVIRRLREMDPERWTTPALADRFKISPEAVRRILKSKYQTEEEKEEAEVGDRLLREVELGSYDTSKTARSSFSTRTTHLHGGQHDPEDEDAAEERYAERIRAPVEPLQEGYRSPILHKWEGGRTSRYANAERWENEPIGHEKRAGYKIQRDHRVAGPPILQENRRRRTGNFE